MAEQRLIHYAKTHLTEAEDHDPTNGGRGDKPDGLWFSVGDAWEEWCRGEGFRLETLSHRTELVLAPDANVLRLTNRTELDRFTSDYLAQGAYGTRGRFAHAIDWGAVAAKHDGIIIAPYVWSARLALSWYYSWDCASGCIWRARAIEKLTPIIDAKEAVHG